MGRRARGSGSIYKRGKGYVAQVQDGYKENGKPKYRQGRAQTKEQAVALLNELIAMVVAGKPIPSRKEIRLTEHWVKEWLDDHVSPPNREQKTHDFYKLMVGKVLPYLGRVELRKLTPTIVSRAFKSAEKDGATPNTIAGIRRSLRACLSLAQKFGYIDSNPVAVTLSVKVEKKKVVYFTGEEMRRLIDALEGSPIENLSLFTLASGTRVGESTGVRTNCIANDLSAALIDKQLQRVKGKLALKPLKTDKSIRTIPLMGYSLVAVERELARQKELGFENEMGLLFLNPEGRPFDQKYVNKHFHAALEKAGLPRTGIHSLRHSAATYMLMNGLNLHQASRFIGHSQIALTSNLYGHVLDSGMKQAAETLQAAIA